MITTAVAKCSQCPSTASLRVIQPRIPCTAGSFAPPEIRCSGCCELIKGMFRNHRLSVAEFIARQGK